jgi:hypothetical protein
MKKFWFPSTTGILSVMSILLGSVACHKDHSVVPDELIGSWSTDDHFRRPERVADYWAVSH